MLQLIAFLHIYIGFFFGLCNIYSYKSSSSLSFLWYWQVAIDDKDTFLKTNISHVFANIVTVMQETMDM